MENEAEKAKAKAKEDENPDAIEVEDSDVEIIDADNSGAPADTTGKTPNKHARKKKGNTVKKPVTHRVNQVDKAERLRGG